MTKNKCVICKQFFEGYGNNPYPIKKKGECCHKCNAEKVIPARLVLANISEEIIDGGTKWD